jgi:hypothetical protein
MTRVRISFEVDLDPVAARKLGDAVRAPRVQAWLRVVLEEALEKLFVWLREPAPKLADDPEFRDWLIAQGVDVTGWDDDRDAARCPWPVRVVSGSVKAVD